MWWGFQDHTLVEQYKEWIDWFWQRAPKNLHLRLLTNMSPIETEMATRSYTRRNMRFWKQGDMFTGTTWVTGDYMIMIVTNKHPHYLVEIHDAVFAQNMRALFQGIWKTLE